MTSQLPKKLLIFIVAYNAEKLIGSVLSRIPQSLFEDQRVTTEVLVIDDCSKDSTFEASASYREQFPHMPIRVLKNPTNLGYGGNQKVGYRYAIDQGFDFVALLHGDGQYAPEQLPNLIEPLLSGEADAVFGSRMMRGFDALKGGMPKYKFIGNKILTHLQNTLVGARLSEWHSGYRLYNLHSLSRLPFEKNSNNFDFDTDIIIQIHDAGFAIKELPIPTYYGDEICHVDGVRYGLRILLSSLQYRLQGYGIFYDAKFDTSVRNEQYQPKFDFLSSHSLAMGTIQREDSVLLVGCGPASVAAPFAVRPHQCGVIDLFLDPELDELAVESWEADLDQFEFAQSESRVNYTKVLALDIIEHLRSPERFLADFRKAESTRDATLVITTPNIAFLPIRLMLALGSFNYGKRGILDRTHTRLFTFSSLRRTLEQSGYQILSMRGIPAPIPLALGRHWFSRFILKVNDLALRVIPSLFSYQIYVECKAQPTVDHLLKRALVNSEVLENRRVANGN